MQLVLLIQHNFVFLKILLSSVPLHSICGSDTSQQAKYKSGKISDFNRNVYAKMLKMPLVPAYQMSNIGWSS